MQPHNLVPMGSNIDLTALESYLGIKICTFYKLSMSTIKLSAIQVLALKNEFPELPESYLDYMMNVGWGEALSHRMIYEGPIDPTDVYGVACKFEKIVLLGDDFQGYCLAYDLDKRVFAEVSPTGELEIWPLTQTFQSYIAKS